MTAPTRRFELPAARAYLWLEGASGFLFYLVVPIASLYRILDAHLDAFQLVMVGTVHEATRLLFEVPTGIVADRISRRRSIVIGFVLSGIGFMIEGLMPSYLPILGAQVVWGIGFTFISGANVAWIADEVGEQAARPLYIRGAQVAQLGAALGIFVSVPLAMLVLPLPIVLSGALFVVMGVVLALVMPERGFRGEHVPLAEVGRAIFGTLTAALEVVRRRRALLAILLASVILGVAAEPFDRLWELQVLQRSGLGTADPWLPVAVLGGATALGLVLGALAGEGVRRRLEGEPIASIVGAVLGANAVVALGLGLSGLADSLVLALAAYLMVAIARGISWPLFTGWVNHGLDSRSRATVNSIVTQANALGQIGGGLAIGWLGRVYSVSVAVLAAAAAQATAIPVLAAARAAREGDAEAPAATEPPAA